MVSNMRTYQDACLKELAPLVGKRIKNLIRDNEGNFGFKTENETQVWIMCDPEGNGPGFAEVIRT